MDFGMPTLIETQTIEDCIKLCTSLQLDFIELNMNFPQCQINRLNADVLNKIKEETGIYFTIHLDENLNVCDFNHEVTMAYLKTAYETIELAKEINSPIINMHLAKGIHITLPDKKVYLFEQYKGIYLDHIKEFRKMCIETIGDANIKVCIENTEGFMPHEKEAIELLLESDYFGLTLDVGHSHVIHNMDEPFYKKHIDQLKHMHIHDANNKSNHLALGDGDVNLEARLLLAKENHCRCVLETKTIAALNQSIKYLKTIKL